MLMLLALYAVAVRCDSEIEITKNNETGLLVNHLRRRLMRDNYDYQSTESDEPPTPAHHRGEPDDGTSETSPKGSHHDHVNNLFVPRAREGEGGGATHAISEKDLLYYVDDDKLAARRAPDLDYSAELNSTTATTPRAKYKLYKIRNKERHRRGGGVTSYRRFIAEKSVSGVAFMPLEPGPLPQFRLPRARRQYMHHHRHHNRHSTTILESFTLVLLARLVSSEGAVTSTVIVTTLKAASGASIGPNEIVGNKSAQFVNHIKNDLRRNNDDYAEPVRINISNPYLSIDKHSTQTDPKNDKLLYSKGKNDLPSDTKGKLTISTDNSRRFELLPPLKRARGKKSAPKGAVKHGVTTRHTHHTEKSSLREIMKTFWRREDQPKYVNEQRFQMIGARQKDMLMKKPPKYLAKMRVSESGESEVEAVGEGGEVSPGERDRAPPGEHLDMAPGKGGRIHAMRNKNYLCQRNVLVPEGPKYDAKGVVYLQAFRGRRGREYPATRAPDLVLPRCCNCCKKSVLGCE